MTRPLLSWLESPPPDRGIRFAMPGNDWDYWSYVRLAELSRRIASGLVMAGVAAGEVVSLIHRSGPGFVGGLFGAMLAGATPSPAAPPALFGHPAGYRDHVTALFAAARPTIVITDPQVTEYFAAHPELASAPVWTVEGLLSLGTDDIKRSPAELALVQFTSGSTGHCRGIRVPYAALESNVAAIRGWLGMNGVNPTASWLPVHHDMGLIGCLLAPVVDGSDLWLLPPEDFVRHPMRYLQCFGRSGARYTAMPSFGLDYIVRRTSDADLTGLDFSRWESVIVGAERIDPEAVERFCTLLAPHGLGRSAIRPAYGLAEATLAVTGLPAKQDWEAATVRTATCSPGRRVEPATGGHSSRIIGCGRPLTEVTVAIVDDEGHPLPDDHVGEILVRGASVAAGYLPASVKDASLTSLDGGDLRTGDAGWLHDGQLFVLGRLGDSTKLRGRTVFAEDLEAVLVAAGMPARSITVLLGSRAAVTTVVAVLEKAETNWLTLATQALRPHVEGADVVVINVPRGAIPRTSSGKPRRRALWQSFIDGQLLPPR